MWLKSICKTNVVVAEKNSSLKLISELMLKHHVGSVVVVEGFNGKRIPCGIITDRDIALALGSAFKPQEIGVEQIMRSHPITIKSSEGLFEAAVKMREYGVKRLPVVTDDGALFGIICADDILTLMSQEINNLSQITETQIKIENGIRMPVEKHLQI